MATVEVDGNSNIIDYSVSDDATPLNPDNTGAAFGQITYSTVGDSPQLETNTVFSDKYKAFELPGNVIEVSKTDGVTSVTLDGFLSKLNRWMTIKAHSGTVGGYVYIIANACGIVGLMQVAPDIADKDLVAAGFEGNVWEEFKNVLSANNIEAVFHEGIIRIRKPGTTSHELNNVISLTKTHSSASTAEIVRVKYKDLSHDSKIGTSWTEFYPNRDDYTDGILSVGAGETLVVKVPVSGSVNTLKQPVCLDKVTPHATYPSGAYCVAGNDGKPILASRWIAGGGSLSVRTTRDPSIIEVVLRGSKVEEYAPYQIAMTAGTSNYYNSLHITGSGLSWKEKEVEVYTGAVKSTTEKETIREIDNPQIMSLAQAYSAALQASNELCGGLQTMNGSSAHVGPIVGDSITHDSAVYRVESVSHTPNNQSFTLTQNTQIKDFNAANSNMTIAQFNTKYKNMRFLDFNERPL